MTQAIPSDYPSLIPYLSIRGAAKAIEFYRHAFGAEVGVRMDAPGGRVGHADLRVGRAAPRGADVQRAAGGHAVARRGRA